MRPSILATLVLLIGACLVVSPAQAQVVREDGVKSIAGILVPASQETAEWTFASLGGVVLFATLDADIYRKAMGGHETAAAADTGDGCSDTEGGCSDDSSGGCSDEEGGPGLFYIEVIGPSGVLCRADKPAPPPGWMRDPRLACALPVTKVQTTYKVRVGLKVPEDEGVQEYYPFLLNVSLRRIAPLGVNIQSAIGLSGNNGF